jgi:hypothetical protein
LGESRGTHSVKDGEESQPALHAGRGPAGKMHDAV